MEVMREKRQDRRIDKEWKAGIKEERIKWRKVCHTNLYVDRQMHVRKKESIKERITILKKTKE